MNTWRERIATEIKETDPNRDPEWSERQAIDCIDSQPQRTPDLPDRPDFHYYAETLVLKRQLGTYIDLAIRGENIARLIGRAKCNPVYHSPTYGCCICDAKRYALELIREMRKATCMPNTPNSSPRSEPRTDA